MCLRLIRRKGQRIQDAQLRYEADCVGRPSPQRETGCRRGIGWERGKEVRSDSNNLGTYYETWMGMTAPRAKSATAPGLAKEYGISPHSATLVTRVI